MTIPVQRPFLGAEELQAVDRVFQSGWLGLGDVTRAFESELKTFLGVPHVVAVSTGTAALHLALDILDLKPGDEVIVPTLTFVATPQAVLMAGATPVFCDVDPTTFNLDARDAASRITPRTKAIMPVHYGGTACDMDQICHLAAEARLHVVEDAAHAFGSKYKGQMVGILGDLTCFSFDPIKNITCGEGGAITTNNGDLADKADSRRMLGITRNRAPHPETAHAWLYTVAEHGFRYHMGNLNAAVGLEQIKRFDAFCQRRRAIAGRYDETFGQTSGLLLRKQHLHETCPFFYVIRVLDGRREALIDHLKRSGIMTGVHYVPNHLHQLFEDRRTPLPIAERLGEEILTLPLFFEMTDEQVELVIAAVNRFFSGLPNTVSMASGRGCPSAGKGRSHEREGV